MEKFIYGKKNKMVLLLIIIFFPKIISAIFFEFDYGITKLVSAVLTLIFVNKINDKAIVNQIKKISNINFDVCLFLIILAAVIQMLFMAIGYRFGNLYIDDELSIIADVIIPVLVAPFTEEIAFRWAATEICIDKSSTKGQRLLFIIIMLTVWTLAHGLTVIHVGVTIAGLILYYIYFNSKNIMYCICFHLSVNLFNVILTSGFQRKIIFIFDYKITFTVLCFMLIITMIYLIKRLHSLKTRLE